VFVLEFSRKGAKLMNHNKKLELFKTDYDFKLEIINSQPLPLNILTAMQQSGNIPVGAIKILQYKAIPLADKKKIYNSAHEIINNMIDKDKLFDEFKYTRNLEIAFENAKQVDKIIHEIINMYKKQQSVQ
jgi:hypothetical protein